MLTIVELAVSPADGALAYLVQSADGYTLVHADADGKNRRELLPAGSISQLRWSPDGTQIAAAVYRTPDATAGLAGGVYLIPAAGGAPRLLQANDPIPDPANPAPESRGYSPEAWSEDGEALILNAYSQAVELCDVAVRYVATDDLVVLEAPEGLHTRCGSAVWDPQGQNIYVGMSRPGYLAPIPGLWRAIPTNGRTVPYIPAEPEPGRFNLVVAPKPLADGALNFFLATVDKLEEPGDDPNRPPAQYGIFQLSADTTQRQQLRDDRFADIENRVLWAADGSGALVEQGIDPGTGFGKLRWVPTSGAPAVELASDLSIGNLRWGP
ncbi:MAG TPA: hypothetical protein VFU22_24305 [Roseiflexaceae bacterium]|nr:hypothetical protein [Roseiflexaceae bacterium]